MRSIERLLAYLTLLFYVGTAVLAVFIVGNLISHALNKPPATVAQVETASPDATTAESAAGETAAAAATVAATGAAATAVAATEAEPPAAEATAEPAASEPAAPAIDIAAGEKVFGKCKACHDAKADGKNKVGPLLWGVVGRDPHSAEGFKYSDAMMSDAEPWTPERLDTYLADPKGAIPGNKMSFAGLKKEEDRVNLIAWLAQQSDAPIAVEELGFAAVPAAAPAATEAAPDATQTAAAGEAPPATEEPPVEVDTSNIPAPNYVDPPARTAEEQAAVDERVAKLAEEVKGMDYQRARYHPIHFAPAINEASDEECLVCHQEITSAKPREVSPAGLKATDTKAWYQTLATYTGAQSDFHYRHIGSDFARATMNLSCTFCHKGNDPREESPAMEPLHPIGEVPAVPAFTNRKMVNPETTCLRCHGAMPDPENIMGLGGPWHEIRADMEDPASDDPTVANGCLSCHKDLFRTNRHAVSYLNAATIEDLAEAGSDTCYGCHGGRQWYRISYPYPRHPWPDMDPTVPDWAKDRPTESDPEYALPAAAN